MNTYRSSLMGVRVRGYLLFIQTTATLICDDRVSDIDLDHIVHAATNLINLYEQKLQLSRSVSSKLPAVFWYLSLLVPATLVLFFL